VIEPKNFLFVSLDGLIGDTAWQILKEGHNVKYYIDDVEEKDVTDGFVPKVDNWQKEVAWADVVVFDDVLGLGTHAKKLRDEGKLVVGGSPYTDKLEDDRSFGQEELKKAGVNIIQQQMFRSFDDAQEYVRSNPNKYVIKPSGEAQNKKQLLFVGEEETGRDVIQVLEHYKKVWSGKIEEFQLQKKIGGVEVAVGAFFNGNEFIYPINVNFEHKKLFPGNIGPSTGEMGTSMFWAPANNLFKETLAKMEPKLKEENYVGYMDINCIVNANGVYPLEFTARFGYPCLFIQQEGMLVPIGDFFYQLAKGEKPQLNNRSSVPIHRPGGIRYPQQGGSHHIQKAR
jgi:phosphoribosylamine--glycine ligase